MLGSKLGGLTIVHAITPHLPLLASCSSFVNINAKIHRVRLQPILKNCIFQKNNQFSAQRCNVWRFHYAVSQSQTPRFPNDKIKFLNMYNYSNSLSYTLLFYWPNSYLGSSLATLSPPPIKSVEKQISLYIPK